MESISDSLGGISGFMVSKSTIKPKMLSGNRISMGFINWFPIYYPHYGDKRFSHRSVSVRVYWHERQRI